MNPFQKAVRGGIKLRVLIVGKSGAGKTYTALALATHLARAMGGAPIALADSEDDSAKKYAGEPCGCHACRGHGAACFEFDKLCLTRCSPDDYMDAMAAAAANDYGVLVLDSISHEWEGPGGCLRMVDASQRQSRNKHAAWGPVTQKHQAFLSAVRRWPGHLIATCRAKEKHSSEGGKVVSLGVLPVQREGIEYEFDVVVFLDGARASVVKTRASKLEGWLGDRPGLDLARVLHEWAEGADAAEVARARESDRAAADAAPPPGDSPQAPPPQLHPDARQRLEALRHQATSLGEPGAKLVTWAEGALRDQLAPPALLGAAERKLETLLAANNPTAGEGPAGTDQPAPAVDPPAETEAEREDRLEREGRELEEQAEPEGEKDYLLRDSVTRNDVLKVEEAAQKLGTPDGAALAGRARKAMRGSGILLSTLRGLQAELALLQAEAGPTSPRSESAGPTSSERPAPTPEAMGAWAYPDETSAGGH